MKNCAGSKRELPKKALGIAMVLMTTFITVAAAPVLADDRRGPGQNMGRQQQHHGRVQPRPSVTRQDWRTHEQKAYWYRHHRRPMSEPEYIYAPPVIYAPSPIYEDRGFNLIIPLLIH